MANPSLKPVDMRLVEVAQDVGVGAEDLLLLLGVLDVVDRHHPLRRALEERELLDGAGECAGDLHTGRAGADESDAASVGGHRVVPLRRMEHGPREAVEALDVGALRVMEDAGGGDHVPEPVGVARGGGELPVVARPLAAGHGITEADQRGDAVAVGDIGEVLLDLLAGRREVTPLRVEGEGVAVDVRRHVAGDAGIGVLAPGAADPIGLFEHGHVVAGLAQLDRGEDARHPRTDDGRPGC